MIIIDGHQSEMHINDFANLGEILNTALTNENLQNRVVTEVRLNDRLFSELYPYQADDIGANTIKQVDIISVPVNEMALAISEELFTVIKIMSLGSRHVSLLFNESKDNEALELFIDLIDVTRNFLSMINVLRNEYRVGQEDINMDKHIESIAALLGELTEILESKDWLLLSDLIEFEFIPQCESWKELISSLQQSIRQGSTEGS